MKKVDYLVEYAKAQVGRPYWMGTYGQRGDATLLAYKRSQYPKGYPTPGNPAFTSQYGYKVHDCNGLVYAASECDTPDSTPNKYPNPYYGVSTLYQHCSDKGYLTKETKLVKGELLFSNNLGHVGIYGGDGYVYHAAGHAYGVLKSQFNYTSWTHHGKFTEMYDYEGTDKKLTITQPPTIRKGSTGSAVKDWQALLLAEGYALPKYGIDGDFGSETDKATREWQKDVKIEVDGIVGPISWEVRLNEL